MREQGLTRRAFLRRSTLAVAGIILAGCAPKVIEKTIEVEKTVEVEKQVEVEVPATVVVKATLPAGMSFWPEWGGKDADALQQAVFKFTQETGTAVEYLPIRDHARMIAAMGAGNPPDLLMTWDSNAVGTWGFEGALLDLNPYIERDKFDLNALHPLGVAGGNMMGVKQIGLSLSNYLTTCLYWNKDALKAAGLDPEAPPQTWEDLWEMAQDATVLDKSQIKKWGYMILGGQDGHPTIMPYGFGGTIYSSDFREVTPDSDEVIESLRWMRKFYEKYGTDEIRRWSGSINNAADSPNNPLYTGEAAMQLNGEWVPSFIDRLEGAKVDVGVAYMPYPQAKPEVKGTMAANSNPLVIPTGAKNPEAGWQLLTFLSRPEVSGEMCIEVGNASPVKEGIKVQLKGTDNALYKWLLEEAWSKGNVKSMTIANPVGAQYMDLLDTTRAEVLEDGRDPVEAMKAVKEEIQPLLDKALKELGI